MIRISLSYIYNLATRIEPLGALTVQETPYRIIQLPALTAQNAIQELYTNTFYAPHLRVSYGWSQDLFNRLHSITSDPDLERMITHLEMLALKTSFEQYKVTLLSELAIIHAYFVSQKGAYDSWSLLINGETMFPNDLGVKVPDAIFDAREAGKCLAYENSTAAGFHVFRVLETVLRRYYAQEVSGKAPPKVRNIAVYVNAMKQAGKSDENILFLLREISNRFRNPLIHPDVILSTDDAIAIFGLVGTAVTEMLKSLSTVPPTTTSPLAALYSAPGSGKEPAS